MITEAEWQFPSAAAAAALQIGARGVYAMLKGCRKSYAKHDPETYAIIAPEYMTILRVRSRMAREHLFGLIGDGTLEDNPPSWKW